MRDLHVILFIPVKFHGSRWKEKMTFCTVRGEILLTFCVVGEFFSFLGAFAKLRKAYSYLRHVCLSDRMEQLGSLWTDFRKHLILEGFCKICRENSRFINLLAPELFFFKF